jgi:cell division protein FtsB
VINAKGQVGTATAAPAGGSTSVRPASATSVRRQQREIDRLQRENQRLAAEIAQLRATLPHRH